MNNYTTELYHHGIKGQKWGVRRYQNKDGTLTNEGKKKIYRSTNLRSKIAKHQNDKIDKSFKNWNENTKKRANAIELGKKKNLSQIAYEQNKKDKNLKKQYKQDNKAYKKAFKANTTYRKGQIKQQVSSDLSRKYLSEARKINKLLNADPNNKKLNKQYSQYMSKHDVERARARKAPEVAKNRSRKKASIKRAMTISAKAAATTAAVGIGVKVVNTYLNNHEVTMNGRKINLSKENINNIVNLVNIGKNIFKYI